MKSQHMNNKYMTHSSKMYSLLLTFEIPTAINLKIMFEYLFTQFI